MIIVHIDQKGARTETVEKMVMDLMKAKWPDAEVAVTRYEVPTSRPDRFSEAQAKLEQARSTVEELRDELQQWRDGMPDNLQDGEKASQLDEAIEALEEFYQACETAEGVEVNFPSMMG